MAARGPGWETDYKEAYDGDDGNVHYLELIF